MGSTHQSQNVHDTNVQNNYVHNVDKSTLTDTNNYREHTKVTNNHNGNSYMHGVTDLSGSQNNGKQSFDLSAGLMNLDQHYPYKQRIGVIPDICYTGAVNSLECAGLMNLFEQKRWGSGEVDPDICY